MYYNEGSVYYGDDAVATADQYADQAVGYAEVGNEAIDAAITNGDTIEWMPLGVFAMTDDSGDSEANMFIQLAVSREGVISGTYYNTTTGSTLAVQGAVDKKTQRAAWTIGENQNTVIETGIYNLTQDQTSALVHFGDSSTQEWLLVRLPEQESEGEDTTNQ